MDFSETDLQPLVVSKKDAAKMIGVSDDTIDRLVDQGDLDRVQLSTRRVGITYKSLRALAELGVGRSA